MFAGSGLNGALTSAELIELQDTCFQNYPENFWVFIGLTTSLFRKVMKVRSVIKLKMMESVH